MAVNKERLLLFAMIASMVIWGLSWSSAKVISAYGSASSLAFLRFSIVPFTLFPLIYFSKIEIKIAKSGIIYVVLSAFFMLLYTLFFFQGLKEGFAGKGGVLVTTLNPIFAYLIGLIISKQIPTKSEFIGLGIGFLAGCVLLSIWKNVANVLDFGNSYFLLCAIVWAIMSKITSYANRFGNAIAFSFWLNTITALGLFFLSDRNELYFILTHGDFKFWANILYFGIINSALATTCFLYAAAQIGAEKASSFIYIVPSMAVLSSWLIMDEKIEWFTIVGGILGILAVFVINGKIFSKS